jgi:DNA-binding NtrC family response regulator
VRILVVQPNADLGLFWAKYLTRQEAKVFIAANVDEAVKALRFENVDVVILDMALPNGGSFKVSDHAGVFHPHVPIIAISSSTFFSGSELYEMMPNARALMSMPIQLSDLRVMVEHFVDSNDTRMVSEFEKARHKRGRI